MAWLARRGYRSLTLDEVRRWATERRTPPGRSVLITFDDAYADLTRAAFPVLLAAGFSGVVFVPTGYIGQTNRWDAELGGAHQLMTSGQIRHWSERGIEFGAHTRSHPDVTRLPSDEVRLEMVGSKADLEAIVDGSVTSFAYPYGSHDDATTRIAASIFELAFTTDPGRNGDGTDRHRIQRSMISHRDTAPDVELRAWLGFSPQERARAWLYNMRKRRLRLK
jgi:peptidoglycan/xylan/chitin deacetylase (PgdA/CDA1 family)